MRSAGVAELKKRLSEFLATVKAGGEVLITERGQPIARIVPEPRGPSPGDEELDRLERSGLIRRGRGRIDRAFLTKKLAKSGSSVVDALLEEREEGLPRRPFAGRCIGRGFRGPPGAAALSERVSSRQRPSSARYNRSPTRAHP